MARIIIVCVGNDSRVTLINREGCEALGRMAGDVVGGLWFDLFVPEEEREKARSAFLDVLAGPTGARVFFDHYLANGNGDRLMLRWRGERLHGGDGEAAGVVLTGEEFGRQAEDPTFLAGKEWEYTFDAAPDLITILDLDHRIRRVNRAMAEFVGEDAQKLVGMNCFECVHGTSGPPPFCPHSCLLADGRTHSAEFFEPRKGKYLYVTVSPIHDKEGRVSGSIHIARDLSDRKLAEDELRQSEERFRLLAENIQEALWLTEPGQPEQLAYASPTFEAVWGLHTEDVRRDPGLWLRSIHEEDRQPVREAYERFIQGSADYNVEYRIVRPDGGVRWIWERAFPIRDGEGNLYRVAGLSLDITSRKKDQEKQQQLNDEIKHFSYMVSHDLRAPLLNIVGFSRELDRGIGSLKGAVLPALADLPEDKRETVRTALEEDLPECIRFITSSVAHMDHLVGAILRLSRLGRRELFFEPLDMNELVRQTLDSLAFLVEDKGVKVTVSDLPSTLADRTGMEQIVNNLVTNAIKYLDPKRPPEISITGYRFPDETVFVVRDNGSGIDQADLTRIFNVFQRVGSHAVPGEGMGLASVRTLVRRHGGHIWCESQLGVGSSFTFTIADNPVQEDGTETVNASPRTKPVS